MKPKNLRLTAATILDKVTNGQSLADCLDPALANIADARDRAFVQALCYGTCRYYVRLDVLLSYLLKNPMDAKDSDVHALLCVGLYQLMEMRVAEHAAVSETVNAVTHLKKPWARGLVNAVLREYLRNKNKLSEKLQQDEEARYAHPEWWIKALKKAWPEHWQQILEANNQHPPMSLRVDLNKTSRDAYLQRLKEHEINAEVVPFTTGGVMLAQPMKVENIPGFAEAEVRVQDGASQLAAGLLKLAPGLRVLDACAAPGGKLSHILETEPHLASLVAVEKEAERMHLLPPVNSISVYHQADVAALKSWWDQQPFDRILLDAPCSASGIVRRHPDIKLLRQPQDINALPKEQARLLEALWPLLKPGGLLVYATCSIFPQENEQLIQAFLRAHADAREEKIAGDWGLARPVGRQILPGMHHMDGFYYACISKLKA